MKSTAFLFYLVRFKKCCFTGCYRPALFDIVSFGVDVSVPM